MRRIVFLSCALMSLLLSSCRKNEPAVFFQESRGQDGVDVDLTRMNSNMVYAEVFNMLVEPDYYEGKTVRMRGSFYIPEDSDGPQYACMVQDASACCAAGLGFSLSEEAAALGLPTAGDIITVVGTYTCTESDGFSTITLINCALES